MQAGPVACGKKGEVVDGQSLMGAGGEAVAVLGCDLIARGSST